MLRFVCPSSFPLLCLCSARLLSFFSLNGTPCTSAQALWTFWVLLAHALFSPCEPDVRNRLAEKYEQEEDADENKHNSMVTHPFKVSSIKTIQLLLMWHCIMSCEKQNELFEPKAPMWSITVITIMVVFVDRHEKQLCPFASCLIIVLQHDELIEPKLFPKPLILNTTVIWSYSLPQFRLILFSPEKWHFHKVKNISLSYIKLYGKNILASIGGSWLCYVN